MHWYDKFVFCNKENDTSRSLLSSLEFLSEFTKQALADVSSTNEKLIWLILNP